jgi:hypothetical protein
VKGPEVCVLLEPYAAVYVEVTVFSCGAGGRAGAYAEEPGSPAAFSVSSIDEALAVLRERRVQARGIAFEEEPREEAYGTVALFRDVYANRWDKISYRMPAFFLRGADRPPGTAAAGQRGFAVSVLAAPSRASAARGAVSAEAWQSFSSG